MDMKKKRKKRLILLIHKKWKLNPASRVHSTKHGKKGYDRYDKEWREENP